MKISVVTVCYNSVDTIEETMLSVLNQTYPDIEYIMIDGGSTDGTVEIIKKYAARIAYWVSEPDKGIFDAMNRGISVATGNYINFMNSGDKFYANNVLEKVVKKVKDNPDFIAGIALIREKKRIPGLWTPIRKNFTMPEIVRGGICNHQACLIKKDLLNCGYDIKHRLIADELFFVKKVALEKATYQPINLIVSNYDSSGVSSSPYVLDEIKDSRRNFYIDNIGEELFDKYNLEYNSLKNKSLRLMRRFKRLVFRLIVWLQR